MSKKTLKAIVYLKGGAIEEVSPMISITQDEFCADDIIVRYGKDDHEHKKWSIHIVDGIEIKYS